MATKQSVGYADVGTQNIGGGDFSRSSQGFSSGGGGFGGEFGEGDIIQRMSGPTPENVFFIFKGGQLYRLNANDINQVKQLGEVKRVQSNVIGDFISYEKGRGAGNSQIFGNNGEQINISQAQQILATNPQTTETQLDPNNPIAQRAAGNAPQQMFSGGKYTGTVDPNLNLNTATGYANQSTQSTQTGQGLQFPEFYQPDPSSPLVVDRNGNPVTKEQYLQMTSQTGLPDNQINWNYVKPGNPQTNQTQSGATPTAGSLGTGSLGTAPLGTGSLGNGTTGTNTTPSTTQPTGFQSTGNPQLDEVLQRMGTYLEDLKAQGKTLNPNIELDPQMVQKFLDQATQEIEPYYSQQFSVIKDQVQRSLGNLQKSYELQKQQSQDQFKQSLEQTREQAAGSGTVFSGGRAKAEQQLQTNQQRALDNASLGLSEQAGSLVRGAEQQIGSRNLNLALPTFTGATANSLTSSFNTGRNLDYFNPSNITGSLERERTTAIQGRKNELEQAERQNRSLNFYL